MITVKVYDSEKQFKTKQQAIETVATWIFSSEGSEQQRYCNVLRDLYADKTYCTDED